MVGSGLSDYPAPFTRFFRFLFVTVLIMSSKCIFNGNYCFNSQVSVRILIPCLAAFEAGFHTELKAFHFCSSRYFIELSVPVLSAHIFPNYGNGIPIPILSEPVLLVVTHSHVLYPHFSDFQTGGKWLSKVWVDPLYLR